MQTNLWNKIIHIYRFISISKKANKLIQFKYLLD